jgi:hypothetical protein
VRVLAAVAGFDITMVAVAGVTETTVVPAGMPVPEMSWPGTTPVRFIGVPVPVMRRFSVVVAPAG